MTCPDADTLNALATGKLSVEIRAQIADHAATCESCHDVLSVLFDVVLERVGRYVIEERLGSGAMGVVYAAHDPELARRVAIKVMVAGGSERSRREAQMLARLHHPNVVSVFDAGDHDGHAFVAMALVDGVTLRAWLERPRSVDDTLRVIRDVARGLASAHAAGVIHRDLKPDNLFVGRDGVAQVGDFGLARLAGEAEATGGAEADHGSAELTRTGTILGTPAYMAPEQTDGEPTALSDQFSLCVTAWEALYGKRPFAGASLRVLQAAVVAQRLEPAVRAGVPPRVRAALERGLRADPSARWPSIDALASELAPRPRRKWWLPAAAIALAAATIPIVLASRSDDDHCAATAHELDDVPLARLTGTLRERADAYARDWLALRREVCTTGGEARMRCLDRARDTLRALVDDTGSADAELIGHAIGHLPALADCRSALEGTAAVADREAGEQMIARIDRAVLRVDLGGPGALDDMRTLAAEADKLGYAPAIVFAARGLADAYTRNGQAELALDVLHHALARAEAAHADDGVALAAAALAVRDVEVGKLDEAGAMVELADAALTRVGPNPNLALQITDGRARLASARGDHAAAIAAVRDLIEQTKRVRGAKTPELFEIYFMLSREYGFAGDLEAARQALVDADAVGPPDDSYNSQVEVLGGRIQQAFLGNQPRTAIEIERRLAALARTHHDRATEEFALRGITENYELTDDITGSIAAYRDLLAMVDEEPDGGSHELRGVANDGIGEALVVAGHSDQAVPYLRAALASFAKTQTDVKIQRGNCTLALVEALVDTGQAREARTLGEAMLRELTDDASTFPNRRGRAEYGLARALWDDGDAHDRARAITLAKAARKDYEAAIPLITIGVGAARVRKHIAEVDAWLARRQG